MIRVSGGQYAPDTLGYCGENRAVHRIGAGEKPSQKPVVTLITMKSPAATVAVFVVSRHAKSVSPAMVQVSGVLVGSPIEPVTSVKMESPRLR